MRRIFWLKRGKIFVFSLQSTIKMFECERCEAEVAAVLRHREYGRTVTHRVTRWLCRDCHPAPPATMAAENRRGSGETAVTDGGTVTDNQG